MYKIRKLTVKNRCSIEAGALVEIEVNEEIKVPYSWGQIRFHDNTKGEDKRSFITPYAQFFLRKSLAKQGLVQVVHTPFPSSWKGTPLVVVKNEHVGPVELIEGEEIGEMWFFDVEYNEDV